MLVLVSTQETQGKRQNVFCFVPEGELVRYGGQCNGGSVDDNCGCRRSMCGIQSLQGTTTMKVVEIAEMTTEKLKAMVFASLVSSGIYNADDPDGVEAAEMEVKALTDLASIFEEGMVLEKRGNRFQERKP